MNLAASSILSIIIVLPLFGAAFIAFLPKDAHGNARYVALWTTIVTFVVSLLIWVNFDATSAAFQFVEERPWIGPIKYKLGVDGISMLFVILNSFVTVLVVIAGWSVIENRVGQYYASFLMLSGVMNGVFSALDGVLFYVFFEATLIPMFIIIGVWGGPNRVYAAVKFFLYTLFGSLLMLVALLYLYNKAGSSFDIQTWWTLPLPLKQLTLAFDFPEVGDACRVVNDAVRAGLKVQSALVAYDAGAWRLRVDLAGTPEAVARSEFDIAAAASASGAKQVAPPPATNNPSPFSVLLTTLPPRLPSLLAEAGEALPLARTEGQPWDGVCRVGLGDPSTLEVVRGLAARHGAGLVIERCPPELKRDIDVFGEPPASFALMQAIKREFDSNRVLSPGRFVGRL